MALEGLCYTFFVLLATEVGGEFCFGAEHQGRAHARGNGYMKISWLVYILAVGEPALPVAPVQDVPVPGACRGEGCRWACNQGNSWSAFVCLHIATRALVFHYKVPVVRTTRGAVMIAKEAVGRQCKYQCSLTLFTFFIQSSVQCVLYIGCILPILHPNALF